ncbi:hypothetical protein BB558_001596 [Smittium angustum]|uniref:Uncharacterized protein n=1 Tax=Smittium angustum TaxID=133377 RepID=A0A2U1JBC3_SMIAN|nr:hypothetical protein BB558_001596 [Smittium angustum]
MTLMAYQQYNLPKTPTKKRLLLNTPRAPKPQRMKLSSRSGLEDCHHSLIDTPLFKKSRDSLKLINTDIFGNKCVMFIKELETASKKHKSPLSPPISHENFGTLLQESRTTDSNFKSKANTLFYESDNPFNN